MENGGSVSLETATVFTFCGYEVMVDQITKEIHIRKL